LKSTLIISREYRLLSRQSRRRICPGNKFD
jgi:hypothetical protein